MFEFITSVATQLIPFILLAFGISISYNVLRATDLTVDGSFVTGAAIFARLVTLGFPPGVAGICALISGALAGALAATIQRGGRIDPLLAGVLATFILTSVNLLIMGRPNISLLTAPTLLSSAFAVSDLAGWSLAAFYAAVLCVIAFLLLHSRFGLTLRALGDNPQLLKRLGKNIELYRLAGFALTNTLAAAAGCLTAQTIGYADVSMGFGMALTAIGTVILGQQVLIRLMSHSQFRARAEFTACFIGALLYFVALNLLLHLDINLVYLKMLLGLLLIFFLRTAISKRTYA